MFLGLFVLRRCEIICSVLGSSLLLSFRHIFSVKSFSPLCNANNVSAKFLCFVRVNVSPGFSMCFFPYIIRLISSSVGLLFSISST